MLRKLLSKFRNRNKSSKKEKSKPKKTKKKQERKPTKEERAGVRHVISTDEGWAIVRNPSDSPSRTYSTKKETVKAAKKRCKQHGFKLVIHKQDGTVQREHDYS